MIGHSRGSMTIGNALKALKEEESSGVLGNTNIKFVGPAFSAQEAANFLYELSDGNKNTVQLQNHMDDFVGRIIGGNDVTYGTRPEGMVPEPTEERRIKGPYCLMKRKEYNRCKIDTQDWSCGSNTFPLACYSNAEYEQYLKTNVSPYPPNESNPPVYGTGATPESIHMRNQKLELESLQNQTRQQTNRDMNNMLKQSFPK